MLETEILIYITWVILMIALLILSTRSEWWAILGGIIWIMGALTTFFALSTVLGIIVLGVGIFLLAMGLENLLR